jgi:hypothetical protein
MAQFALQNFFAQIQCYVNIEHFIVNLEWRQLPVFIAHHPPHGARTALIN